MNDVLVKYDEDCNKFLRIFNIRYNSNEGIFEVPISAYSWEDAEKRLKSIQENGEVHNELVAKEE